MDFGQRGSHIWIVGGEGVSYGQIKTQVWTVQRERFRYGLLTEKNMRQKKDLGMYTAETDMEWAAGTDCRQGKRGVRYVLQTKNESDMYCRQGMGHIQTADRLQETQTWEEKDTDKEDRHSCSTAQRDIWTTKQMRSKKWTADSERYGLQTEKMFCTN